MEFVGVAVNVNEEIWYELFKEEDLVWILILHSLIQNLYRENIMYVMSCHATISYLGFSERPPF